MAIVCDTHSIHGTELLQEMQARQNIHLPVYKYQLDKPAAFTMEQLKEAYAQGRRIVLQCAKRIAPHWQDTTKPLFYGSLIKLYLENNYPKCTELSLDRV
jgi:hypothetical protein